MKMYILVLDEVPKDMVPVISAHASLSCYLNLKDVFPAEFDEWLNTSFKKVVCEVNASEFHIALKDAERGRCLITESSLGNKIVAVAFAPRKEYPKCFKFFKLWRAV